MSDETKGIFGRFDEVVGLKKVTKSFRDTRREAAKDVAAFADAKAKLSTAEQSTLSEFDTALAKAQGELSTHTVLKDGVRTAKSGVSDDVVRSIEENVAKAETARGNYLRGLDADGKVLATEGVSTEMKAVRSAFDKADKSTGEVVGVAGSWAGRVRVHGVKDAATKGLSEMKVWEKGKANVTGFARIGAVGVGATMAMDGIFRSKTSDGQDRGALTRLGEVVVGGGVGALGLVTGRAI